MAGIRRELRPPLLDTIRGARRFAQEHELSGSLRHQIDVFRKARSFGLTHLPPMPLTGLIVDVGANAGGFTDAVLAAEPRARVIAIEPGPQAHATLRARFGSDPRVRLEACAVADRRGEAAFNVTATSEFSSLLRPDADLARIYGPGVGIVDTVPVATATLDDLVDGPVTLLKVDVQGGERDVFAGGPTTLSNTRAILVEALFAPHYQGEASFPELHAILTGHGFALVGLGDAFATTEQVLWCDLCYVNAATG